jgi:hypothetical protein
MTALIVIVSLFFAASRFAAPGHPVSGWGTWEVASHFFAAIVLWEAGRATLLWLRNRGWSLSWLPAVYGEPFKYRPAVLMGDGTVKPGDRPFPWLLHACWFVPSMVELALFLIGPFNPAR